MVTNILEGFSAFIFRVKNSTSVTRTVHRNISVYLPVDMVLCPKIRESSMLLCGSFQKVCIWWQHSALLHMTELISCVALLLLSQRCPVFMMTIAVWLWFGKDYKEVISGRT